MCSLIYHLDFVCVTQGLLLADLGPFGFIAAFFFTFKMLAIDLKVRMMMVSSLEDSLTLSGV